MAVMVETAKFIVKSDTEFMTLAHLSNNFERVLVVSKTGIIILLSVGFKFGSINAPPAI